MLADSLDQAELLSGIVLTKAVHISATSTRRNANQLVSTMCGTFTDRVACKCLVQLRAKP